jgi:hypothetical protein
VHRFDLLNRCRAACTDRPHWLVGDHQTGEAVGPNHLGDRIQLAHHHRVRQPGITLVQSFSDTDNRHETRLQRLARLSGDARITLAKQRPTLRMTDDDHRTANVGNHLAGSFTGISARPELAQVLRAYGYRRACHATHDFSRVHCRHEDCQINVGLPMLKQGGQQFTVGRPASVGFPVSGYELSNHTKASS